MQKLVIRNAVQFPITKLKPVFGQIPKSIYGTYFKNGTSVVKLGQKVLHHWFHGCGGLLKLQIKDGQCWAKYKILQTPKYKKQLQNQNFDTSSLFKMVVTQIFDKKSLNDHSLANTSVLRLKGHKELLALCESSAPLRVTEKDVKTLQYDNLGFIEKGFSAHHKIDPKSGDIFNIGFDRQKLHAYRMTKDLKLIVQSTVQLRAMQSIHDCCLAGDYFIVIQCSATYDKLKLLQGYTPLQTYYFDYDYGKANIWIFAKEDFKLVKKIQYGGAPFFMYHFTNGYSDRDKIVIQYVKYSGDNAQKMLDTVTKIPQITVDKFENNGCFSALQILEISLKDFSLNTKTFDFDCEFPVCEDSQVGSAWRYTYFLQKKKGEDLSKYNTLVKFDRSNFQCTKFTFEETTITEPALIRTEEGLFIMMIITKKKTEKSYVTILNADKLSVVAQMQLPQLIPFGFHGKWLQMETDELMESIGK